MNCTTRTGDSTVAHHSFLALGTRLRRRLYRDKYQATQRGVVRMNIYGFWNYPFSPTPADVAATQRSLDFMGGW